MRRVFLITALCALATVTRADVPAHIPVQGLLTDADGLVIDGEVEVTFSFYADAFTPDALWTGTQQIPVEFGLFTTSLELSQQLMAEFAGRSEIWLGVQVAEDEEMPRISIGTVPYAVHAQNTAQSGVPSGAVMTFNLPACPEGWHELTEARGRALVGLPGDGTLAGTQGAALGDLDTHEISEAPSHTHPVTPPQAATDEAGSHNHGVSDPGHQHNLPSWVSNGGTNQFAIIYAQWNIDNSVQTTSATTGISLQDAGAHAHTVTVPPHDTGASGPASVDVTMPYIQLLVCQKD